MTEQLPAPPVPAECDLRDFAFMPLEVRRLLTSETWLLGSAEEKCAALTLWCEAWHQVPASSLPDNDKMLAHLSQSGARWKKVKAHVLRSWVKCSDGRLYHPVVAEKALESWAKKEAQRERSRKANDARWGKKEMPKDRVGDAEGLHVRIRMEERQGSSEDEQSSPGRNAQTIHEASRKESRDDPKGESRESKGIGREEDHDAAAASESPVAARELAEPDRQSDLQEPENHGPPVSGGDRLDLTPPICLDRSPEAQAFKLWQAAAASERWPPVDLLTSTRRFKLRAILALCGGPSGFETALEAAKRADFLRGTDGRTHAWFDLDWLLDEQKFTRLMEGRYAQKREHASNGVAQSAGARNFRTRANAAAAFSGAGRGGPADAGDAGSGDGHHEAGAGDLGTALNDPGPRTAR